MKRHVLLIAFAALVVGGCNVGNAPEPMNPDQLKSAIEKLPPKDQIDYIRTMPIPQSEKDKKIAEVEAKTGYKAEASAAPKTGP